ncbi:leucine-rich repeat domain-containing protein [Butyrivibrio sp. NC2002]|uniref:leucine-rich repeat domain-containing protein n=1 Tax=Butyrivibrio sp. NC2002 TaxID=1410610 RepID=UPI00068EA01C|nr:leucine-rich repeat domain-containing protein [Butyrivibrio sp. NC2002]
MKRNKKIWSYALACALAMSNLSVVAAPFTSITAFAASTTGVVTSSITLNEASIYKGDTSVKFDVVLSKALDADDNDAAKDYEKIGITVSKTELTEKTFTVGNNVSAADVFAKDVAATANKTYEGIDANLSSLTEGEYIVQVWNYKEEDKQTVSGKPDAVTAVKLLGTASDKLTVYDRHVSDVSISSDDTSIAKNQGSITATVKGDLNIEDKTDSSTFKYVVVGEEDYLSYLDEVTNNTVTKSGKDILKKGNKISNDDTLFTLAAAGVVKDEKNGEYITEEVEITLPDSGNSVTAGTYYLVASETDITNDLTVTPVIGVYEFDVTNIEGNGFAIGTGLSTDKTTITQAGTAGTITDLYLGTDVQLKAYVKSSDGITFEEADSSKVKWASDKPAYVTVGEKTGLVHAVKAKSNAGAKITATYTPDKGKPIDSTAVTITNVAKDVIAITKSNANSYLNIENQLTAKNQAGVDITADVEWSVDKEGATVTGGKFIATKPDTYAVTAKYEFADDVTISITVNAAELSVASKSGTRKVGNNNTALDNAAAVTTADLIVGDSAALVVKLDGVDVSGDKDTVYASDDEDVAYMKNGTIYAVGSGVANITISRADSSNSQTIVVTVSDEAVTYAVYDKNSLNSSGVYYVGDEVELGVYVNGELVDPDSVTWATNGTGASVTSKGVLSVSTSAENNKTATASNIKIDGKTILGPITFSYDVLAKDTVGFAYVDEYTGNEVNVAASSTVSMVTDSTREFYATYNGESIDGKWSSATTATATINTKGLVTAKTAGTSSITFTPADTSIAPKTFTVSVAAADIKVTVDEGIITDKSNVLFIDAKTGTVGSYDDGEGVSVAVGGTLELSVIDSTSGMDITDSATYTTTDTEYISVGKTTGIISGIKATDKDVSVTITRGTSTAKTLKVKVLGTIKTESVDIDPTKLSLEVGGDSEIITASVSPSTTVEELTWKSSDEKIATVTDNGNGTATVTPVAAGTATITATSGDYSATCKVTVTETEAQADAKEAAENAANVANTAAEKANTAAKAAEANPTAENIKAAQDAATEAKAAAEAAEKAAAATDDAAAKKAATDAAKAATDAATAATTAAANAQEKLNSDGSAANTPAPVGNELKDASGNATGFVVTDATASAPTVEYKGTDADKKATKLAIPATVKDHSGNTYTVTSIAPSAFAKDTTLKTLTIPNTVTKIGKNAFKNCKNLKKVTIKTKGNLTVGKNAFKGMKKGSKIVVKGVKGAKKTKVVNKVKKQVTSSKTTVK